MTPAGRLSELILTRAVCIETARLFEQCAAKHPVEAQDWADLGVPNSSLKLELRGNAQMLGAFVRKTPQLGACVHIRR
jgi:hypothetical protein